MTLKQHGMSHVSFKWTNTDRTLGCFWSNKNRIDLSRQILKSFVLFKEVLLHELAHACDYNERGTFKSNGRNDFHGKDFKRWCAHFKIPARTKIPA